MNIRVFINQNSFETFSRVEKIILHYQREKGNRKKNEPTGESISHLGMEQYCVIFLKS